VQYFAPIFNDGTTGHYDLRIKVANLCYDVKQYDWKLLEILRMGFFAEMA
jgi:hypothetical protein